MDAELGADISFWNGSLTYVTHVDRDSIGRPLRKYYATRPLHPVNFSSRVSFSYQVYHNTKIALQPGLTWWYSPLALYRTDNTGGGGLEFYVKLCQRVPWFGAMHYAAIAGVGFGGAYVSARISFALMDTREYEYR